MNSPMVSQVFLVNLDYIWDGNCNWSSAKSLCALGGASLKMGQNGPYRQLYRSRSLEPDLTQTWDLKYFQIDV